jgi:hypothetical protein
MNCPVLDYMLVRNRINVSCAKEGIAPTTVELGKEALPTLSR